MLSDLLRSQDTIAEACKLSANLIEIGLDMTREVQKQIDTKKLTFGKVATLHRDHIILDAMSHEWTRRLHDVMIQNGLEAYHFLVPDSSPQATYNMFLIREDTVCRNLEVPYPPIYYLIPSMVVMPPEIKFLKSSVVEGLGTLRRIRLQVYIVFQLIQIMLWITFDVFNSFAWFPNYVFMNDGF